MVTITEKKDKEEQFKAEEPSMVERANLVALRLEEANKKTEELIARQERLAVESALGGRSEAGKPSEEKPKELTPKEYKDKIMRNEL